jgi:hypothetical protein
MPIANRNDRPSLRKFAGEIQNESYLEFETYPCSFLPKGE